MIEPLSEFGMDTRLKDDGRWDYTSIPDATADNMKMVVDKLNEVINHINQQNNENNQI